MEYLKKKWVLAVAFVLILAVAGVFYYFSKSNVKTSYELVAAQKGNVVKTISVSGKIKPAEAADLAFERTGKVANISVQVGDRVKAGQQLAVLDQTDYSDQVAQAIASLDIAEAGLVQAEANLKKEKKKKTELENTHQSKYTVDVQRAQIKSAQAAAEIERAKIAKAQVDLEFYRDQHEKIVLVSPIDGVVSAKNIEVGETSGPTATAISVMDENDLEAEVAVSQVDISEIKVGEKARIAFDSCLSNEPISSQVVSVDPADTPENGNSVFRAKLEIRTVSDCMKPGAAANAEIVVSERENVLMVPTASVVKRSGKYFILIWDETDGLREKEVRVGLEGTNGMTEIQSGIEEGEKVVSFSK